MTEPVTSRDVSRPFVWSLLLVAGALVWWAARDYLQGGAPYGDDNSSHLAWMLHISNLLRTGQWDFYFGQQNLGVPMFMAYQPLPGLLTGTLYALTASWMQPWTLFKLSIVLLWSVMPLSWYVGSRWFGLSRTAALCVGLLVLSLQDPYNYGLTFQSVAYRGLYAQLYGMFFLPLALGSLYRFLVEQEGPLRTPVLFFWLTFLSHAFFGIYVGIASFLMIWVKRELLLWRLRHALVIYGLTLLLLLFWVIPLLLHVEHVGGLPWKQPLQNGWPLSHALLYFVKGMVFDYGRFPILTVLVLLGLVLVFSRLQEPVIRWLLLLLVVTSVLFLGRTQWGEWYNRIPLHRELNVMRYISGLHFCGLLLAALGIDTIARWLQRQTRFTRLSQHALTGTSLVLVLASGIFLYSRYQHWNSRLKTMPLDQGTYQTVVKYMAKNRKYRYVANEKLGTTSHFYRDLLAALAGRAQLLSYGMTFHATLGTYYAEYFDFSDTSCRLFNVHTLVSRGEPTGVPLQNFRLAFQSGPHRVYQHNKPSGYFDFARIALTITGAPKALRPTLRELTPQLFRAGLLPHITPSQRKQPTWTQELASWFVETTPSQPTRIITAASIKVNQSGQPALFLGGKDVTTRMSLAQYARHLRRRFGQTPISSRVLSQRATWNSYQATVSVQAVQDFLFLKVNYFPYWTAYVGQKKAQILRVAPNYMALSLPRGKHKVRFIYHNPSYQKWLFLLSVLAALLLFVTGRFEPREDLKRAATPQPVNDPIGTWIERHYGKGDA